MTVMIHFTGKKERFFLIVFECARITESEMVDKKELAGRDEIVQLVDAFYGKIRGDSMLGPIFDEIAQVDWEAHLPKMYAFWQTVLFRDGGFRGDPIGKHARLVPLTEMGREQFDHWLALFYATVDELFVGENAEHIKRCAEDMANVIHSKINHVADERVDTAVLTPEQRERYAKYREG